MELGNNGFGDHGFGINGYGKMSLEPWIWDLGIMELGSMVWPSC